MQGGVESTGRGAGGASGSTPGGGRGGNYSQTDTCYSRRRANPLFPLCAGCSGRRGCVKPWLLATPPAGDTGEGGEGGDGGAGGKIPRRLSADAQPFKLALSATAPTFLRQKSSRDTKQPQLFVPAAGSLRDYKGEAQERRLDAVLADLVRPARALPPPGQPNGGVGGGAGFDGGADCRG